MIISELIDMLQRAKDLHGDVPVHVIDGEDINDAFNLVMEANEDHMVTSIIIADRETSDAFDDAESVD